MQNLRGTRSHIPTTHYLRRFCEEDGQIIPWVVFLMFFFLGMCALVVDIGHAMLVQRQLQASSDAAALAGAQHLADGTYQTWATNYSSTTGGKNAYGDFQLDTLKINAYCSTTVTGWGIPCAGTGTTLVNAITVTQTATIPMVFTEYIGIPKMTLSAMASASKDTPMPANVAIILDTTPSMGFQDNNCGATQIACAKQGVQKLLAGLAPSVDFVSLFTFPNLVTDSASKSYCDSSQTGQTDGDYTFPSTTATSLSNTAVKIGSTTTYYTYQVAGFDTNYRSSDSASTLNSSSQLATVVGAGSNTSCGALQAQPFSDTVHTYFAGVLYAAQSALLAEQNSRISPGAPPTQNVIILLSDGDATAQQSGMVTSGASLVATSGGSYPSWNNQCAQAVAAATTISGTGTIIYTISYGASTTSGCANDSSGIKPCTTMRNISTGYLAGDTSHFYSDYNGPSGDAGCTSTNGVATLAGIFDAIGGSLANSRLIPNGTV